MLYRLEGCSIAASRLTGAHKTSIMRLLVEAGQQTQALLDEVLTNLPCGTVEADEICTFVRKKQHRPDALEVLNPELGGQYVFVGIIWCGRPDLDRIGTSYVERHNGTTRQQMRRFTRSTLAFSKCLRNLRGRGRTLRSVVVLRQHPTLLCPIVLTTAIHVATAFAAAQPRPSWGAGKKRPSLLWLLWA